jgi:hypothetical protein
MYATRRKVTILIDDKLEVIHHNILGYRIDINTEDIVVQAQHSVVPHIYNRSMTTLSDSGVDSYPI